MKAYVLVLTLNWGYFTLFHDTEKEENFSEQETEFPMSDVIGCLH